MKFKKHQKIKTQKGKFSCVCADPDTAVFAPFIGSKVKFKNMFAVTRNFIKTELGGNANGFEFENLN